MAKNSVPEWDTTPINNSDVGGTNIAEGCPPSNINNAIRQVMAQLKAFFGVNVFRLWDGTDETKQLAFGLSGITTGTTRTLTVQDKNGTVALTSDLPSPAKGYIFGLSLTRNVTDTANDIDISTGEASSDAATPVLLTLASALTKRLDAAWAVGTNQGGLDTGAVGNNVYHIWIIRRSDTGVVDVLFSLSSTSPTMPTNYDQKRLIGFVVRASAANLEPHRTGEAVTFTSADQSIVNGDSVDLPHGLNARPGLIQLYLKLTGSATLGYTTGEEVLVDNQHSDTASSGWAVVPSATSIFVRFGSNAPVIIRKDTGGRITITNSDWRMVVRARV